MEVMLKIRRQELGQNGSFIESIKYEYEDEKETVITALMKINAGEFKDEKGLHIKPIAFECNCLQKKCGACAVVINKRPMLACDAKLSKVQKNGQILIEPLSKFPVIEDLKVDRSLLYDQLREVRAYIKSGKKLDVNGREVVYEASKCLMCGCCLEVCPNYYVGGDFYGAPFMTQMGKLFSLENKESMTADKKEYLKHGYEGCGKSLACKDICPVGIDTEKMLSRSNAYLWRKN